LQAGAVMPVAQRFLRRPLYVGGLACVFPLTSMWGTPKIPPQGRLGNLVFHASAAADWSLVPSLPLAHAETLPKSRLPAEAQLLALASQSSPFWSSQQPMKPNCWVIEAEEMEHNAHFVPGHPASSSGHSKAPLQVRMAECTVKSTAVAMPSAPYSLVNVEPNCLQKGQFAPNV